MKIQKENRRVRMTKQAIRESLVEMMQDLPISKISVKALCEAADINRSTFYAHYTDQYDLLAKIQADVVADIKKQLFSINFDAPSENTTSVIVGVLQYAQKDAPLFKALLSEGGDSSFQDELMFIAQKKVILSIREDKRIDARTAKYVELFAISGSLSIARKWLDDDCMDPPQDIAKLMIQLLFEGMKSYY